MAYLISIIVPIYNVEKYIKQCVDSILAQTYKNIEVILVDDGSPDNCPQICDSYAAIDNRVKVVHKKNGGLMSARQAGLKAASGDYIGFVDGDDWIEPDMYADFARLLDQYSPDMALCEFLYSFPDKDTNSGQLLKKSFFTKEEMKEQLYGSMLFKEPYYSFGINPCCWSKIFKKELLESNLYNVTPNIKIGEDAAFTYPCLLQADSLAYSEKYSYHYRVNPESMTKAYDENCESTVMIPYEILKNVFEKYNDCNLMEQLDYFLLSLVNGVVRNEASSVNKKPISQKKETLKKLAVNPNVSKAVLNVNASLLPLHTRLLVSFLRLKNANLLYLYTILIRRFL